LRETPNRLPVHTSLCLRPSTLVPSFSLLTDLLLAKFPRCMR
jgi:hypothetical protein